MSACAMPKGFHRSANAEGEPGFTRAKRNRSAASTDANTCSSSTQRQSLAAMAVTASSTTAGFAPGATTNTRNVRDSDIDERFDSCDSTPLIPSLGRLTERSDDLAETVPCVG